MTRSEHLIWCKERALRLVEDGDLMQAYNSMISDLTKHPKTSNHPVILSGMILMRTEKLNTKDQMREFIKGVKQLKYIGSIKKMLPFFIRKGAIHDVVDSPNFFVIV